MSWRLVYTKPAQKDAEKRASAGLKEEAKSFLAIVSENPIPTHPARVRKANRRFGWHLFATDQYSAPSGLSSACRARHSEGPQKVVAL